jgi:hypothetical protein
MRYALCLLVLAIFATPQSKAEDHGQFHPASIDVYFSPKGGATEARLFPRLPDPEY